MKSLKIGNSEVQEMLSGKLNCYPKYATQLLVLANQNAQGTRPKVVGQMSDLIQEFEGTRMAEWEVWYKESHPYAIDNATEKIYKMVENFKDVILNIDKPMIKQWVEELVIIKTFSGLRFQEAILKKLSKKMQTAYRLAEPKEESLGIDGFVGDRPVSIKPSTYKLMKSLKESIDVTIIYYEKRKNDIIIEYDF